MNLLFLARPTTTTGRLAFRAVNWSNQWLACFERSCTSPNIGSGGVRRDQLGMAPAGQGAIADTLCKLAGLPWTHRQAAGEILTVETDRAA
jgi:hypothetical protein